MVFGEINNFINYFFTLRFIGCNTIWGIFILLNLIIRCVVLFSDDTDSETGEEKMDRDSDKAAGAVIIIEFASISK
jgi:cadmium resistance protein CadD (predicted permease)